MDQDYWRRESEKEWTRVHLKPRTELFVPDGTGGGPPVAALSVVRVATVSYGEGRRVVRDRWDG
eukprot:13805597-Alexandrium_andersonii.AAC.1